MIGDDCPAPTSGIVPCPSTVDQHLSNLRKILPRGIAWVSVFDPASVMYGYFRAIAATYQWANDQFCEMINEMFCSTRNVLAPDYLTEFGLPNPCNPNQDPCSIKAIYSAKCADIVDYMGDAGWDIQCLPQVFSACGCAASGCNSAGGFTPATYIFQVDTEDSPAFAPGQSASSGIAGSGISTSGCINEGPGTIPAVHCLLDAFLPAQFEYSLVVI